MLAIVEVTPTVRADGTLPGLRIVVPAMIEAGALPQPHAPAATVLDTLRVAIVAPRATSCTTEAGRFAAARVVSWHPTAGAALGGSPVATALSGKARASPHR